MSKSVIEFTPTDTGLVIGDLTVGWCKKISDQSSVSQDGMTIAELGNGCYVLENPNVSEDTAFRVHITADSTKYCVGVFEIELPDGDTAVDHNTGADGSADADYMRVLYAGDPVDNAVIEAYQCTLVQYNAGARGAVKARSESKADGRWLRPVYIDGGLTYTVVIYKQGAFQPLAIEVILP